MTEHSAALIAEGGCVIGCTCGHDIHRTTAPQAIDDFATHVADAARADAQAEVANAFVAWAAKNEIAEPPLDWAWFGEITRRYSLLHEQHQEADRG